MQVASTAIVHPGARIHPTTTIGDYSIIEDNVEIGSNNRIDSHVIIKRYTTLGESNHVHAGVQLGIDPMDKKFREESRSYLRIGNHNVLREYVTISRATKPEAVTLLGDSNYIMSYVHIAHDCQLGSNITICTCTGLAGHITVEDDVFMSHGIGVHQFSKVGRLCMVAANTRINTDIPPYFLVSEFDAAAHGLNIVGLRRNGFSREAVTTLKQAYRLLYRSGLTRQEALTQIEALGTPETLHLVSFIRSSKRGICPDYRATTRPSTGTNSID
ncbi:MAG TPA: acyl-ACP--UDP-N-acetylglucosamine O-acyltransferase [Bryobacteraceae bacterium]|nr:acyl-ACP--UDP-N-acetylglucosamine O-acyltransferase [Bryobacteraceae bacterium]